MRPQRPDPIIPNVHSKVQTRATRAQTPGCLVMVLLRVSESDNRVSVLLCVLSACMHVCCVHVCMCTVCISGAHRSQKKASAPLRFELQMGVGS